MNSTTARRRGAAATLVSGALLTTMVMSAHPVAAKPTEPQFVRTGATATATEVGDQFGLAPQHSTGKKAIDRLGDGLADAAMRSHISKKQLKHVFKHDPTMQVDADGNLEVADSLGGTGATVTTGNPNTLLWSIGQTQLLHSRPSATRKIYLDFNGHTTSGTLWNTQYGLSSFTTPVWSRDGDTSTFNTDEAATIQAAYASVAEDFAPFNVDVTTQDPGVEGLRMSTTSDAYYGIRVVIGEDNWMHVTNSGYAKIGSFNWSSDTPAYCFTTVGTPTKQIAECISHEAGHTVGLLHDGLTNGEEYYAGHANWAPIMGNPYGRAITQWSKGEYAGANNTQDDLYVIASYLGWVADDYVGTTGTTTTLAAGATRGGAISWGTGEYDAFTFTLTGTRRINIQSWEWIQQVDTNLNMRIQVTNAAATVLASNSPTGTTRTNLTTTLPAGTYYVFLDGVGEGSGSTGYTNYASMGYYNILLSLL